MDFISEILLYLQKETPFTFPHSDLQLLYLAKYKTHVYKPIVVVQNKREVPPRPLSLYFSLNLCSLTTSLLRRTLIADLFARSHFSFIHSHSLSRSSRY